MQERLVVLDTETTGLEADQGHRIIELGGVEIIDRRITGTPPLHEYINPERDIDDGALSVHGITREFLLEKPTFARVWARLRDFIKDSELIIHNAPFDVGFLNEELRLLGPDAGQLADHCAKITDSLAEARRIRPGRRNSLDALCLEYQVDASQRGYHGALLDAQLLAEVYLAMTGGQTDLGLGKEPQALRPGVKAKSLDPSRRPLRIVKATAEELAAHELKLQQMEDSSGVAPLWRRAQS